MALFLITLFVCIPNLRQAIIRMFQCLPIDKKHTVLFPNKGLLLSNWSGTKYPEGIYCQVRQPCLYFKCIEGVFGSQWADKNDRRINHLQKMTLQTFDAIFAASLLLASRSSETPITFAGDLALRYVHVIFCHLKFLSLHQWRFRIGCISCGNNVRTPLEECLSFSYTGSAW